MEPEAERRMNLAFSTLGCNEWDLGTVVEKAAAYGYGGVELRGREEEHVSPRLGAAERVEIRRLFRLRSVAILGVTAYTTFAHPDDGLRREAEGELAAYAELAHDLGCGFVRTFIGDPPSGVPLAELTAPIVSSLERVGRSIAALGVKILMETHDSASRAADLSPILERLPLSAVGVLWDCAHSWRAGESLHRSLDLLWDRIGYVHLKDEYTDDSGATVPCLPGRGVLPIRIARDLLLQRGYVGSFCLEWERKWHPEMAPLEEALREFRKLMLS